MRYTLSIAWQELLAAFITLVIVAGFLRACAPVIRKAIATILWFMYDFMIRK